VHPSDLSESRPGSVAMGCDGSRKDFTCALFLARLLADADMNRHPLFDQNDSS